MLTSDVHGVVRLISATVKVNGGIEASASVSKPLAASARVGETVVRTMEYSGEYEFTPSRDSQEVYIAGLTAKENIVINPIPSNYGRIEYDGSSLYVI